jgi:hypothetical protein
MPTSQNPINTEALIPSAISEASALDALNAIDALEERIKAVRLQLTCRDLETFLQANTCIKSFQIEGYRDEGYFFARANFVYHDEEIDHDPYLRLEDELIDILSHYMPTAETLARTNIPFLNARDACVALMGQQAYGAWIAEREASELDASSAAATARASSAIRV